jgi:hypothetical protein
MDIGVLIFGVLGCTFFTIIFTFTELYANINPLKGEVNVKMILMHFRRINGPTKG